MERAAAKREISEGRDRLQQFFGEAVSGFAYPFGTYNEDIKQWVSGSGHAYGRTTASVSHPFPPDDAMLVHPCGHFLAPDLWSRYEIAKQCGVWSPFQEIIARISADPGSCWGDVADLFNQEMRAMDASNRPPEGRVKQPTGFALGFALG